MNDEKPWEDVQDAPGIRNVHCIVFYKGTLDAYRNALEKDEHVFHIVFDKERAVDVIENDQVQQVDNGVGDWVVVLYEHKQYFGEKVSVVRGEGLTSDFEVNVCMSSAVVFSSGLKEKTKYSIMRGRSLERLIPICQLVAGIS